MLLRYRGSPPTRRLWLAPALIGALAVVIVLTRWGSLLLAYGSAFGGRRFRHESHASVVAELGPKLRPSLMARMVELGASYPPSNLSLVALKEERVLEVWTEQPSGHSLLRSYPILAASGGPGPKLREGDHQVPEGFYALRSFNPRSKFHLSVLVGYPNEEDREAAQREHRSNLGGDIFIHGMAASVGCIAIGNPAIEELYVLLSDVGLDRSRVLIAPSAHPRPQASAPPWLADRYAKLSAALERVRARAP